MKKETLESEKISMQSILEILSSFDVIYDKMNATERRDLIKYLIVDVQLFNKAEQKVEKRFVKEITYKFPIEQEILAQFSDKEVSVESIALLARPAW